MLARMFVFRKSFRMAGILKAATMVFAIENVSTGPIALTAKRNGATALR